MQVKSPSRLTSLPQEFFLRPLLGGVIYRVPHPPSTHMLNKIVFPEQGWDLETRLHCKVNTCILHALTLSLANVSSN